jgi:hypothetical protein
VCHRDGTVTYWSVTRQQYVRHPATRPLPPDDAAALPDAERRRVRRHLPVDCAATAHACGGTIERSDPIDGTPDGATITYCARCAAYAWGDDPVPSGMDETANLAAWNAHERRSPG